MEFLEKSPLVTLCEFKGKSTYYHCTVNGRTVENIGWSYDDPLSQFQEIREHVVLLGVCLLVD